MKTLLILSLVVVGLLIAGAVWLVVLSGPSVALTETDAGVMVDLRFLGEYCVGVSSVQVVLMPQEEVVWHVEAAEPPYSRLCTFQLRRGKNTALPVGETDLSVVHPTVTQYFQLESATDYSLVVCGNNGAGKDRCTTRSIGLWGASKWQLN